MPGFGSFLDVEEFYSKFVNYFKGLKLGKDVDGFTLELLCSEAYHDIYGLNDFDDKYRVFPSIEYTNADTLGDLGPKAAIINEYRNNDILGRFGLSLKDYLEMPIDITTLILSRARMERNDEKDIQEAARRQAELDAKKK